ncbi:MAG: SDR family NAD(P)-dependent oxidoreductase [Gammaproteobacteria bacterium]|nr:SDR family NAD(P)-dependent oxidoreductase [Gammaproteobacteria bacterium]MXY54765.1 SDR family NAD(P)-dependent oxidoreductase [Gammaproteobacteria bacterium]MYB37317.1 SDR family NAD(P)-dependent oxidoreductase [Gammaproteobacteria bacterium]
MSEFEDKIVVVTGAAGTLGTAVAATFHDAGARVTGIDIVESDAPWRTTTADLIDPGTATAAFAELGDIDVLANIAGGFTMGDAVVDTSDATWDFMMNLNARTVFNAARAVVPAMKAAGRGKIINISARGGLRGAAAMGAYAASKAVVQRLTETLADELKADGINVNCILPSIIDTPQNRRDMPKARFDHWVPPADIAAVVAFLASNAARSIHGASIPVEGLS